MDLRCKINYCRYNRVEELSRDLFVLLFEAMKGTIHRFLSADMAVVQTLKLGLRYGQTGSGKTYTMRCSAER